MSGHREEHAQGVGVTPRAPKARLGMGLVGPGFVGVHHVDAVRRLGFVDVVAVADVTEASAASAAAAMHVPTSYGSIEALVANPAIDALTARLYTLLCAQHGLAPDAACWLAFGSEGRGEQTIATDQDNGLIHPGGPGDAERWRALGAAVNDALAACGYPLCKGGIMAGRPECCLSTEGWRERFAHWIDHGAPQDLLNASIFFDLRPVAGNAALAAPLRRFVAERAPATPRFLNQLALNALTHRPPLAWHGGLAGDSLDLKLQGTALFVEAARVLALAAGVGATGTRARLEAVAGPLKLPAAEVATWAAGFEYLQLLRLGVQAGDAEAANPNLCAVAELNEIDRRVLRETLRAARRLQQRVELDWAR